MNQVWLAATARKLFSFQMNDIPPIVKITNCQFGNEEYDETQLYHPISRGYHDRTCVIEFFGYREFNTDFRNIIR